MNIGRRIAWVAMLAGQPFTLAAGDPVELTLTVRVYDYAALPGFELHNAMAVTKSIFRDAGIGMRWVECSPLLRSHQVSPDCDGPLSATGIILNIVRRPLEGCAYESLGCALQDVRGIRGTVAYVFQQRLEENVARGGSARFRLLGFAMAHELGHLLLGPGAHSKSGIMQPHWSAMAMPFVMHFSLRQAELIRSRLRAAEEVR
jgi:hypothetical protein